MQEPGYWLNETSGQLKPVTEAYLEGRSLTPREVEILRLYLKQWIQSPVWSGPEIGNLRHLVDQITSVSDIHFWLNKAELAGIDPL